MTVSSATSSTSSTTSSSSSSSTTSSSSSLTTSGTSTTSTIDWTALIQSAVDAKLTQATQISTKITSNEAKITAYQTLQTALKTLSSGLSSLATSMVNSLATNVFATRAATISATGDVSASSALSMSVNNGAATGSHTLTISQIATAHKVAGTTQSSQTTALGYSGTFSLGLSGGTTADITVTSDMSLQDVVDAVNAQTSTTNVEASIVQVSSGSYELVLTGTEDAADITYSSSSGDDILNKLGVTDSSGAFATVLQTAQAAEFTLDGISLTRNTNDITDVLSGVTFDLLQATPSGTTLNISIGTDTSQISSALQTFVTNYNAFRDAVIAQQTTNSDGTAASSAVLFGDGTMRDIMNTLQDVLGTSVGGLTMADLGLSFNEKNELELDTGTLSTILSTNLSGVTTLLSAQTKTSSSQLSVVNTGTSPQSFTLDLTVDSSGNLTAASVGGDSSLFTVSGNTIVGNSGTAYAGMAFTYTGSTSQSITVTSTQGLATQIYQFAKTASSTTGSLQTLIDNLTSRDETLQAKVDDIKSAAATYQTQLTAQYAKYQAAIESANNTLTYLKALLNASSSN
ncbi:MULTISPECIES: flagellar filament capping protein FliD [Bradyrhizobium]|jgi:flagellar hook-associated protein 2|uniref:Flagellar hook-associated protein 2 n=2 Tax=Pseudomonadota TaxID=1224 RepID=A0ABS5GA68_9BRAD|nr:MULTISPECIES: flagellar filament capping protein FliD [Bradyrhizobium]ABQ35275.1 Putative flagellar hook-associated protein 2 (HAP2, fliD protein) [Bradyrhizobium sp. BTAi1]MBR1138225.1 flagellar filament capping protein FliD [Bradyrhizobium denitrificans]MCL8489144.1 flagellar filament capping protein FliD [Bradyrhizobium denitrificans]MDU1496405.1 flagellar filament capping protein FliD [Bradyrhizobium sp.]MDU1546561.1 flagellar filament capping protein FliD [Bradyrhizobium sp.]